jgi:type I restriction enzyme M protein
MEDRDTKGDLYEYMLGKIATAGQNGQFRTPRHIIQLMVELTAPTPKDVICDPACGTGGFLVAAGEYLRARHPEVLRDAKLREHFHHRLFHGFDFDNTMLRIGSMNMLLHGVENPDIRYRDSLAQDHAGEEDKYTLLLANPPFAGSLDYENTAKDLLQIVKTKKTELLFLALFLRLLKPGGRAAVIVPDGVLFGSSKAHQELRRILVEEQEARRRDIAARRRVPALRRGVDGHPAFHEDKLRRDRPGLVLRCRCRRLVARRQAQRATARRETRSRSARRVDSRRSHEEQPA